jgi:hypothetical protein
MKANKKNTPKAERIQLIKSNHRKKSDRGEKELQNGKEYCKKWKD